MKNKSILLSIKALLILSGCAQGSEPTDIPITEAKATPVVTSTPESTLKPTATPMKRSDNLDIAEQYANLTGIELYNAVMMPKYEGSYMYELETSNQWSDISITML